MRREDTLQCESVTDVMSDYGVYRNVQNLNEWANDTENKHAQVKSHYHESNNNVINIIGS